MSFNSENPKPTKQRQYGLKLSSAHKATTKERHCTPIDAEMHPKIADRTFLFFQPDFHNHVRSSKHLTFCLLRLSEPSLVWHNKRTRAHFLAVSKYLFIVVDSRNASVLL